MVATHIGVRHTGGVDGGRGDVKSVDEGLYKEGVGHSSRRFFVGFIPEGCPKEQRCSSRFHEKERREMKSLLE